MSFAEQILNKLFPVDHKERKIIQTGLVERTPTELEAYAQWSPSATDLANEISRNFNLAKRSLRDDLDTIWFENSSANGFQISLHALADLPEPWMLADWFKSQIKQLDYRLYSSSFETTEHGGTIAHKEIHYLKPPYQGVENEFGQFIRTQKFGNILIELNTTNKPKLKFLVTKYHDRSFEPALPFSDLLSYLFPGLDS